MVFASVGIAIFIWLVVAYLAAPYDWNGIGTGHDARPYWTAIFDAPYLTSRVGDHDAYLYSPAFLQLIAPLRALPWQGFMAAWEIVLMVATLLMVGPVLLGAVLVVTLPELLGGNISLLLAAAIVFGFRWPATWAFVLLTKVTPGIGLIWFGVRREWKNLGIALGATAAVVGLSILTTRTGVWSDWINVLAGNATTPITSGSLPVPLLLRAPIGALVIVWGALTNRRWTVPVGCLLALPVIWYGSLAILVGVIPLVAGPSIRAHWDATIQAGRDWWSLRRPPGGVPHQPQEA
jgi:hypothetical protein